MEFLARDGVKLGDKSSLRQLVHAITGIPLEALGGRRLTSFSEVERFSWMEKRETTLGEDKVYGLLGIFDVEIPVDYTQGWAGAYQTLRGAIDVQTKIIADLRVTNPRDDKKRIEQDKGGLISDICNWIFEHEDFRRWQYTPDCQSLWIRGDPGKGKTMLICGIIDELERDKINQRQLCYFFCQATDGRINNATAVLRGLLYMLVDQQPALVSHIERQHGHGGRNIFEDANSWVVLTTFFSNTLQDVRLKSTTFVIDGLDECTTNLQKLLDFVTQTSILSNRVKWLFSSRDWPIIDGSLRRVEQMHNLRLELNAGSISQSVRTYGRRKVRQLAESKGYDEKLEREVLEHLDKNSGDTFLWTALVCQSLYAVKRWDVRHKLSAFPPGLDALYARMMEQIEGSDDKDRCKALLATIAAVYRPITLKELGQFINLPEDMSQDMELLEDIVRSSGCFLTLRNDTPDDKVIFFVHQSAKDYIVTKSSHIIYPAGMLQEHERLARLCIQRLCEPGALHRDLCQVKRLGVRRLEFDLTYVTTRVKASVPYASSYWAEHLYESNQRIRDGDDVHNFLLQHFLHWLEALSWLGQLSGVIVYIQQLRSSTESPGIRAFLDDAVRFVQMNREIVDHAPLQLYASALIFTPTASIVRTTFQHERPKLFALLPNVRSDWSAELQCLQLHGRGYVEFSPDGTRLVTTTDGDVSIRDATTGAVLTQLSHSCDWPEESLIAFSPDSTQLAVLSDHDNLLVLNVATGAQLLHNLEDLSGEFLALTFLSNSPHLALALENGAIQIWDTATGTERQVLITGDELQAHPSHRFESAIFSPDTTRLAAALSNGSVQIWDVRTGARLALLNSHTKSIISMAFSYDGRQFASAAWDSIIRIWDTTAGTELHRLTHRLEGVSIKISPDGSKLAMASHEPDVSLWDINAGDKLSVFEGHSASVLSIAFSPNGARLASTAGDGTLRLWSTAIHSPSQAPPGHSTTVRGLAISPDGSRLASSTWATEIVQVWSMDTGAQTQRLIANADGIDSLLFSPSGIRLAVSSRNNVEIWDAVAGIQLLRLVGHDRNVVSVAFSHNGMRLASASNDSTVRIWDMTTGVELLQLAGHSNCVLSVAFSPDSAQLASGSRDGTVKIWDPSTGTILREIASGLEACSLSFSSDCSRLALAVYEASEEGVHILDAITGEILQSFDVFTEYVAFSANDQLLCTDHGQVALAPFATAGGRRQPARPVGLGLNNEWVQVDGKDVLWLPYDYRGHTSAVHGNTLAIGQESGAVSVLRLDTNEPEWT